MHPAELTRLLDKIDVETPAVTNAGTVSLAMDHIELAKQKRHEKYLLNREVIKARERERYHRNREARIASMVKYRDENREALLAKKHERELRDPEPARQARKRAYEKFRQDRLEQKREYHAANSELIKIKSRAWRDANPARVAEIARRRRTLQKSATPTWADYEAMNRFYSEAKRLADETGIPHEVDHIVPIKHPLVCGLHCQFNLQVLTKEINRAKHNKFEVE